MWPKETAIWAKAIGQGHLCTLDMSSLLLFFLPYMGIMTVNGARPFEQTLNPISTVGST